MGLEHGVALAIGQRLHPKEVDAIYIDIDLFGRISERLNEDTLSDLSNNHYKQLRLLLLNATVEIVKVEVAQ